MSSEVITIFFENELEFAPFDGLHFDGNFAADVFHELRQPGAGLAYEAFSPKPRSLLSTSETSPSGKISRQCEFGEFSISMSESRTKSTVEQFSESVADVLKAVGKVRGENPPVFGQRITARSIWKPTKCPNPLVLLAGNASRVIDMIDPFNRPPSFFGMRFRFTPADEEDLKAFERSGGAAKHDFLTVRYEIYSDDTEYIWIEVESQRYFSEFTDITKTEEIAKNISETHEFMTNNGIEFLEQFDVAPPPDEEDGEENDEQQE